ncbi:hypothetical protein DEO72_LG2g1123 [Vigna unguiculata]|uniref:Uncharacterized protein n=1 Tax=Vigna unguiculata TaxID=3917 RepID=A0A4D6KVM6_VIGUN|nr:hypothetical protein DEO72_LG2g1123 [Vigna unguiculata]
MASTTSIDHPFLRMVLTISQGIRNLQEIKSLVSPGGKSHIAYLNSSSVDYTSVGQLHIMSIGFKLKSKIMDQSL